MKDKLESKFGAVKEMIRALEKELNVALPNNPHMRIGIDALYNELLVLKQNYGRISHA